MHATATANVLGPQNLALGTPLTYNTRSAFGTPSLMCVAGTSLNSVSPQYKRPCRSALLISKFPSTGTTLNASVQ